MTNASHTSSMTAPNSHLACSSPTLVAYCHLHALSHSCLLTRHDRIGSATQRRSLGPGPVRRRTLVYEQVVFAARQFCCTSYFTRLTSDKTIIRTTATQQDDSTLRAVHFDISRDGAVECSSLHSRAETFSRRNQSPSPESAGVLQASVIPVLYAQHLGHCHDRKTCRLKRHRMPPRLRRTSRLKLLRRRVQQRNNLRLALRCSN